MPDVVVSVLAFLLAILILIPFHEFGHFWVARRLGVTVQRFAVGFGKVILSHRAKDGVEYCICAIPLGGYVKMLDEREGEVAPHDLPFAFNRQKVWKRFLIVLAGPLFNILLAFLLSLIVFKVGFEGPIPMLNAPIAHSPAAENGLKVGDEIIAIEGKRTPTVENVRFVWEDQLSKPQVVLTIARGSHTETISFTQPEILPSRQIDFLDLMGIDFMLPPLLGTITLDSPAMKAGLQEGDRIMQIDGVPVKDWTALVSMISALAHKTVILDVLRAGKTEKIKVVPMARPDGTGMIGVHIPRTLLRPGPFSWADSVEQAYQQTYEMLTLNVKLLAQMATGSASFDNISGPVTIARVAGTTAQEGVVPYLYFLALISIGLAVLNLLPIPLLDGGHLLFYVIEIVMGRPLSERAQAMALGAGIILLMSLMLLALWNDMMHWVS